MAGVTAELRYNVFRDELSVQIRIDDQSEFSSIGNEMTYPRADKIVIRTRPPLELEELDITTPTGYLSSRYRVPENFSVEEITFELTATGKDERPRTFEFTFNAESFPALNIWIGGEGFAIAKINGKYLWTSSRTNTLDENGNIQVNWDFENAQELNDEIRSFLSLAAPLGFIRSRITGTHETAESLLDSIFSELEESGQMVATIEVDNPAYLGLLQNMWRGLEMIVPSPGQDLQDSSELWQLAMNEEIGAGYRALAVVAAVATIGGSVADLIPGGGRAVGAVSDAATDAARRELADALASGIARQADKLDELAEGVTQVSRSGGRYADAAPTSSNTLREQANRLREISEQVREEGLDPEHFKYLQLVDRVNQDWREVRRAENFEHFLEITEGWHPSRRGYSFEYWVRRNKAWADSEEFQRWGHLTLDAESLGLSGTRRADRFVTSEALGGGRLWDFKHYRNPSRVDEGQLRDYVQAMNSDEYRGLVYMFSTEDAARRNLDWIRNLDLNIPEGRTVNILFLTPGGSIRRAGRVP